MVAVPITVLAQIPDYLMICIRQTAARLLTAAREPWHFFNTELLVLDTDRLRNGKLRIARGNSWHLLQRAGGFP